MMLEALLTLWVGHALSVCLSLQQLGRNLALYGEGSI
jgi:hypothetical protein